MNIDDFRIVLFKDMTRQFWDNEYSWRNEQKLITGALLTCLHSDQLLLTKEVKIEEYFRFFF